ncbi:MAG: hypothetical protein R3336_00835 [Phycisphaeraceae bacterium]|nr:hypothetical protein [Phycisphaeraceae bacterium]
MKKRTLTALITLNGFLVAALALAMLAPVPAPAQGLGGAGGSYLIVAGEVKGRNQQDAIYIMDVNNQGLAAVFFNSNNDRFEPIDRVDLNQTVPQPGQRRR